MRDKDGSEAGFSQSGLAPLITAGELERSVYKERLLPHVEVLRNNTSGNYRSLPSLPSCQRSRNELPYFQRNLAEKNVLKFIRMFFKITRSISRNRLENRMFFF